MRGSPLLPLFGCYLGLNKLGKFSFVIPATAGMREVQILKGHQSNKGFGYSRA
jgi:hypothetical protein